MGKQSKEMSVLELFFNEPTKHWHFKDIVKQSKVGKSSVSIWLSKFLKKKLIFHHKPHGKMPYFISNHEHPSYKDKKRIYALNRMYETGLLTKLQSLKNTKAIIIFGSFARSDWHTGSDVDIFILGDPEDLKYGTLWEGREVQVHAFKTKKNIKEIRSGLMNNVINGYFIKGDIQDLVEVKV